MGKQSLLGNLEDLSVSEKKQVIKKLGPVKGKGKATLVQAWRDPESSRRLKLPDL
jgi:hypothetical protein